MAAYQPGLCGTAETKTLFPSAFLGQIFHKLVGSSSESDTVDIDVSRTTRWLIASAIVVFFCGILAIVLPLTFSIAVATVLGWLFFFAAAAHLIFGLHFGSDTSGWHALIAGLYCIAAICLLVNPLLGVVLLTLVIGVVLIAEGMVEIVLFFMLRDYQHVIGIMIDGLITLILGILVCAHWPPATLDVVPYLVGIGFILSGISRLLLGTAIRGIGRPDGPSI